MIKNLMAMLVLASSAMAPAAVAEMKIVVLDPVRAILESDEGKVLVDAANKEMESEQNELRSMAEQIQEQQAKLQKDGEILSDSDKRKIVKDIESMQADLQFGSQKLQKTAQDKRQEILQTLAPKYDRVLKDLIQIDQIDMILAPNSLQYANDKHDITRRVVEKLNEARD